MTFSQARLLVDYRDWYSFDGGVLGLEAAFGDESSGYAHVAADHAIPSTR